MDAEGILLFFRYQDRPGVVGRIGTTLGRAGVNIGSMQVSRRAAGGEALMALTVDSPAASELLHEASAEIGAPRVRLWRMSPVNRKRSCCTNPITDRRSDVDSSRMSTPSIVILPRSGS